MHALPAPNFWLISPLGSHCLSRPEDAYVNVMRKYSGARGAGQPGACSPGSLCPVTMGLQKGEHVVGMASLRYPCDTG